ncbi:MAG: aminoglycoside phosphotransferase family protein, partial [Propionibacteriaceae bacterium]|nr:aminoglycoside phosphotransferase family protein [Propionibacteriaceae bacterium]
MNAQLGEQADTVRDMHGGFSPGVAAVVSTGNRALFVKAVGSAVNAESLRLYQVEREVTSRIPAIDGILKPMSSADLDVDGETFAVMVFPALDGDTPRHPWRRADL